eukprot:m.58009 g.58009  ORF g.58009 m.58009 type:complete len:758 (+) comp11648_c0_seq3:43-2316(+)
MMERRSFEVMEQAVLSSLAEGEDAACAESTVYETSVVDAGVDGETQHDEQEGRAGDDDFPLEGMAALPQEILEAIFAFQPPLWKIRTAARVCKRWEAIVFASMEGQVALNSISTDPNEVTSLDVCTMAHGMGHSLTSLDLTGCARVDSTAIQQLERMCCLTTLKLGQFSLTTNALRAIYKLPNLQVLSMHSVQDHVHSPPHTSKIAFASTLRSLELHKTRAFCPLRVFTNLERFELAYSGLTNIMAEQHSHLKHVAFRHMSSIPFNDVKSLSGVESLVLEECRIHMPWLGSRLVEQVFADAFREFSRLLALELTNISNVQLNSETLVGILAYIPNKLEILAIKHNSFVDGKVLRCLAAQHGETVVSLDLTDCTGVDDTALSHLAICPKLEVLCLARCHRITDCGLMHLKQCCSLHRLSLERCSRISLVGLLGLLDALPALVELDLHGLNDIAEHPKLWKSVRSRENLRILFRPSLKNLQPALDTSALSREAKYFVTVCGLHPFDMTQEYVMYLNEGADALAAHQADRSSLFYRLSVGQPTPVVSMTACTTCLCAPCLQCGAAVKLCDRIDHATVCSQRTVWCPNYNKGCKVHLNESLLLDHLRTCMVEAKCTICNTCMPRPKLFQHQQETHFRHTSSRSWGVLQCPLFYQGCMATFSSTIEQGKHLNFCCFNLIRCPVCHETVTRNAFLEVHDSCHHVDCSSKSSVYAPCDCVRSPGAFSSFPHVHGLHRVIEMFLPDYKHLARDSEHVGAAEDSSA